MVGWLVMCFNNLRCMILYAFMCIVGLIQHFYKRRFNDRTHQELNLSWIHQLEEQMEKHPFAAFACDVRVFSSCHY